jgi:hypothetical protein
MMEVKMGNSKFMLDSVMRLILIYVDKMLGMNSDMIITQMIIVFTKKVLEMELVYNYKLIIMSNNVNMIIEENVTMS